MDSVFTESLITPEQFAEVLCDDLDLNPITFIPAIAQAIRQQIDGYPNEGNMMDESVDQRVIVKVSFMKRFLSLVPCAFPWNARTYRFQAEKTKLKTQRFLQKIS